MLRSRNRFGFFAFFMLAIFTTSTAHAQLSGNYTIGSGGNYTTFTTAVNALKTSGVSGPTVFEIKGGVYNEQIEIPAIAGASAANTIMFRPATTDTVKLQFEPSAFGNYVVRLTDADFIRFEGIYFNSNPRRTFTSYGGIFLLAGNVDGLRIRNCTLAGSSSFSNFNTHILIAAYSSRTNNLLIERNVLQNGSVHLYLQSAANNPSLDSEISSNRFIEAGQSGIYLERHRNARLFNNFVTLANISSNSSAAIHLLNSPKTLLYHNSVYSRSLSFLGTALFVDGASTDSVQVKNNIFVHANDGYAAWFSRQVALHESDYNVFHTTGSILIRWVNDKTYADLRSFQTEETSAARFERNSLNVDPGFSSLTTPGDLHTKASFLDGKGTPTLRAAVLTDIDGENRSQLTPVDIGADAFIATQTPLAGTYTIGAGSNFPNFTAAVAALKMRGVSAPVTFTIRGGVYAEQIEIPPIGGASATNTITFKPATTDTVKLQFEPIVAKNYVVRLTGADHIIFDGIYFDSTPKRSSITSNTYGNIFSLIGGIEGAQIRNCELRGFAGNSADSRYALIYASSSAKATNLRIEKNIFLYGSWQIYLAGNVNNPSLAGEIFSNRFVEAQHGGIYLAYNRNARIFNNFVTVANTTTSGSAAVHLFNSPGTLLYHNSVYSRSNSSVSAALLIEGASRDSVQVKNNVLMHAATGYAAQFSGQVALHESDYNVYHTAGSTLLRWVNNKNYADLASFKADAATARFDRNSLEADPGFSLATPGDLHTRLSFLDGKGTPILRAAVLTDIDGENRSELTPVDIGADAFIVTQAPLAGTYTIGAGSNYLNFTAAIATLKMRGVSAPVTFAIKGGVYTEQIEIPAIGGASAMNTITFKAATADTVKLQFEPVILKNYVVNLAGADHIVFDGIYLDSNPKRNANVFNTYGNVFAMIGAVDGAQIRDCTLQGFRGILSDTRHALINVPPAARVTNLRIEKNVFLYGSWQVYLFGNVNDMSSGGEIFSNRFVEAQHSGIYLAYHANARVFNNFITVANTNTVFSYAIQLFNSPKTLLYHNSVYSRSAGSSSAALTIVGASRDSVQVKNNVLMHAATGYAAQFSGQLALHESDFNVFHTTGSALLRWINAKDYADLALFKADPATASFERNSLEADPGFAFAPAGDLHTRALFLDGRGTASLRAPVLTDIDGEDRSALTPVDIGADAYRSTLAPLAGTYIVGSNGNYPNLRTAIDALKMAGVAGPVIFAIKGGTYAEQIEIPVINGASAANTITFRPLTADTVKIQFEPTVDKNYIVRLLGADHIHFDRLFLNGDPANNNNGYGRGFSFAGALDGIQIRNCLIKSRTILNSENYALLYSDDQTKTSNLLIKDNLFLGGSSQIYLRAGFGNEAIGSVIANNRFMNAGYGAVFLAYYDGVMLEDNKIISAAFYGFSLTQCDAGVTMRRNEVDVVNGGQHGISIRECNGPHRVVENKIVLRQHGTGIVISFSNAAQGQEGLIANNFINVGNSNNALTSYGLTVDASFMLLYHNSAHVAARGTFGAALLIGSGNNLQIKNNIFANSGGGYAASINRAPALSPAGADHNNFYTTGPTLIQWQGRTYADLAAFKADTATAPFERNSIKTNPLFRFNTPDDLHTRNAFLDAKGTPILTLPVAADIDGEDRAAQSPVDLGADAFVSFIPGDPNIAISNNRLDFGADYAGTSDTLRLTVSNLGSGTLDITGINNTAAVFSVNKTPFALNPNQSRTLLVIFTPRTSTLYADTLKISSTDPDTRVLAVALRGEGFTQPDLEVTRVLAPPNAASGQSIRVDWTIKNIGNDGTKAAQWYDEIYLLNSPVFDLQNDFLLGRAENFSALNAGEAYANTATYALPRGISGNYYVFVRTDLYNQERERREDNNRGLSAPMQVTLSPYPDLQIAGTVAPDNAFSGDSVQIRWTVKNNGSGRTATDKWSDTIFLSKDDSLDLGFTGGANIRINETVMAVAPHNGVLEAGASYTATVKVKLPHAVFGKYFFFVYTDQRGSGLQSQEGEVYEYNFELNNWNARGDSSRITLTPPADLTITQMTVTPPVASLGEDVAVQWTVKNAGSSATFETGWSDFIYLSRSAAFKPDSALALGGAFRSGAVKQDSGYTARRSIRIPAGFSGQHYLFVQTDAGNNVFEYQSDNNNVSPPAAIFINTPNLVVSAVEPPPAGNSGQNLEVRWQVTNRGPGAVFNHAWTDRIYLSKRPDFAADSALAFGSFNYSGALRPDSSYIGRRTVTLPNGFSGEYYVFVETDADNRVFENLRDNDNRSRSRLPMRIDLSPWPDLQVTDIQAPQIAHAGDRLTATWTVTNKGRGTTTSAAWTDYLYLSPGATYDPGRAILLASAERNRNLDPAANYAQSRTVTLPVQLAGTYTLSVRADAGNTIYEHTDESNNFGHSRAITITAYPAVNLAGRDLTAPPAALSGAEVTPQWTVENIGPGATLVSSWLDRVYLSTDKIFERNKDLLLATVSRNGALRPAEKYSRATPIRLPNGMAGDFFFIVEIDAENAAGDSSRGNNVIIAATLTRITLAPSPDLVITKLSLPRTVNAGQPLMVTYSVENRGAGGLVNSAWFDAFYLSNNTTLEAGDPVLKFQQKSRTLAPRAGYTDSVEVEMPSFAAGTYFLIAKADSRNDIYEHNAEDNNVRLSDSTGVRPIIVIQPQPADLIVSGITMPANAVPGEDITISWTLKNVSSNRAIGRLTDVVYISADTAFQVEDPVFGVLTYNIDLLPGAAVQKQARINLAKAFRLDADGKLTEELPGLAPGNYHAIVRTNIRNNIRESSNLNNALATTATMSTDVRELKLGVPATGTLAAGEKRYYKLQSVDAGATIQLDLQSSELAAANELYVAFGRTPTLNDFDFAGIAPQQKDQRVVIPSSKIGNYFLLLNNRAATTANMPFTLLANKLNFAIHSVETNIGGNTGVVTVALTGAQFDTLMQVQLEAAGDTIVSAHTVFIDPTKAYAAFNLAGAARDVYNVVVINENSARATLPRGFEVVAGSEPRLRVGIEHSQALREGGISQVQVYFSNEGNVDIHQELFIESANGHPISLSLDGLATGNTGIYVPVAEASGYPSPNLRPGASGSVLIFVLAREGSTNNLASNDQAILPFVLNVHRIYKFSRRIAIPIARRFAKKAAECFDCVLDKDEHLNRNFLNREAQGTLTRIDEQVDISSYSSLNRIWPGPGLENLQKHCYYKDQNCVVWTLLSADESGEHCETEDCSDAVKLVRTDPNNPAASFETVRLLLPGENRESLRFANQQNLRFGLKQQTYNFIDHRWDPLGHICQDYIPHFACGSNYNTSAQPIYAQPTLEDISRCNPTAEPPTDQRETPIVRSVDPNDITGPTGFGDERWITATQTLPYTIRFENDSTKATAAAQVVTIRQKLDSTLDSRSFRLGSFGFSNRSFTVPENRAFYSTRLDLRDSLGVFVDVNAGIDVTTNEAFWILRAIDPATGQLPVFNGFLPVNNAQHRGEGFANYTIRPKSAAKTRDVVRAKARIVFDANEPLDTPEIFNTIDAALPRTRVEALPPALNRTTFTLRWSGQDDAAGSQVRQYAVYVAENAQAFELFQDGLTDTSLVFSGDFGNTYRFFVLATDNAGNVEPSKTVAEVTVTLDPNATAVADNAVALPKTFALHQSYPNPFSANGSFSNRTTTIKYDLPVPADVKLEIFDILGRRVRVLVDAKQQAGFHNALWDGKTAAGRFVATGVYFYRIETKGFVKTRKMLLVR